MTERTDGNARPQSNSRGAWVRYWQRQGQPWRTQPEIPPERKEHLMQRLAAPVDIRRGRFPFRDVEPKLSRADIEWLLATHHSDSVVGPVDWDNPLERSRVGLDLRGADLRAADLLGLPLARMIGSLSGDDYLHASVEQRKRAAVQMDYANLRRAHLEGAALLGASLVAARLKKAHLENAELRGATLDGAVGDLAHLECANLVSADLRRASFYGAFLQGADLDRSQLDEAHFNEAHLDGANLWRVTFTNAQLNRASLAGAFMVNSHLQGANLTGVFVGGMAAPEETMKDLVRRVTPESIEAVQKWCPGFPNGYRPADMRRLQFDASTTLDILDLGKGKHGSPSIADIRWNGANLTVIEWSGVERLGDERYARRPDGGDRHPDRKRTLQNYRVAVRAYRQLTTELEAQGLSEDAARFSYRAQVLQRDVFRRERKFGAYLFALLIALLAGYGYRLRRILIAYAVIVSVFAAGYLFTGHILASPSLTGQSLIQGVLDGFQISLNAIHGRVFFVQFGLDTVQSWLATAESIVGIVIEGVFVAMLIQRFFGR